MSADLVDTSDPQKINWTNCIAFGLFHLGAVAALFMFSWHALAVALFLYWMCTGLGISMGYHRLHTHRSYQVPLALEYFFAVCGTLTLEGGMAAGGLTWAGFWWGRASIATPRRCRGTRQIWRKIASTSGSTTIIGFP